jgi:Mg2+-importing ATPase
MEYIKRPKGQQGLTTKEAEVIRIESGRNEFAEAERFRAIGQLLGQFKNPLILILLAAAVLSAYFGEVVSAAIIIITVLASVVVDFANTYKSEKAVEALKNRVSVTASVRRDGTTKELALAEIVPGDVVELTPGDIIPADGTLNTARDFFMNESSLTGESFPVERALGEGVYMGASVVTGEGVMTVTAIGKSTKFGAIAGSLSRKEEPTEFDRGIKDFSFLIMRVTFALVLFIFFINALGKHDVLESLLFATALAVGLTPELLPVIITFNLSKGSLAMAKHGVIVKKLSAIQNFGSMDILCTDKTGTLTEDRIVIVKTVDASGEDSSEVFEYGYVSSEYQSGFKSPLDTAIAHYKTLDMSQYQKIDEIPFDYERKRESIVAEHAGKRILITKGASESIFSICTFPASEKEHAYAEYKALSEQGFRVLAVATKELTDQKQVYAHTDEAALRFVGFIAFFDPPKESAKATLAELEREGIAIKIITGDNEFITRKIASDIALPVAGVLTGEEVAKLSDDALRIQAETTTIFARVTPEQKQRIITALRKGGHVVGYLGDGINDAPSLKAADVGISVNNAVDVAKESADLILLQKSLADLVGGVAAGRTTIANTLKYLMMALSSNFGNMFSMAAASLFLPFLPMLPTQILLNNLIYDSSQFAIPLDTVDREALYRPRRFDIGFVKRFMLVFGPLSSAFDILTFLVLMYGFHLAGSAFQTGWFLESIATQTLVVYVIRTKKTPFLQSSPSKYLVGSTLLAVIVGFAVVFSDVGGYFRFVPLALGPILAIAVIVFAYLVTVELAKHWFYKSMDAREAILNVVH